MSFSAHIDNKKKDILVVGKGPTQGLEHTLTAEKLYTINLNLNCTLKMYTIYCDKKEILFKFTLQWSK